MFFWGAPYRYSYRIGTGKFKRQGGNASEPEEMTDQRRERVPLEGKIVLQGEKIMLQRVKTALKQEKIVL